MAYKNKMTFRVFFNNGKQWFDVFIADSSRKFMKAEKCWAYYQPAGIRKSRKGYFGSIHLSRSGVGLVSHELLHLLVDWVRARKPSVITESNEERIVSEFGEIVRRFWSNYYKYVNKTDV